MFIKARYLELYISVAVSVVLNQDLLAMTLFRQITQRSIP